MSCSLVRTASQKIDKNLQMIIKTIFEGGKKIILEFTDVGRFLDISMNKCRINGIMAGSSSGEWCGVPTVGIWHSLGLFGSNSLAAYSGRSKAQLKLKWVLSRLSQLSSTSFLSQALVSGYLVLQNKRRSSGSLYCPTVVFICVVLLFGRLGAVFSAWRWPNLRCWLNGLRNAALEAWRMANSKTPKL